MTRRKSECKRGHKFTRDNTYVDTRGIQICKECRKIRKKKSYLKHAKRLVREAVKYTRLHPEKNRANVKRHRDKLRQWLRDLKKTLRCSRCPEYFWACLDFHHVNPKEKEFEIRAALDRTLSRKRILAEIAKCEVLCANCHRKEHFKKDSE